MIILFFGIKANSCKNFSESQSHEVVVPKASVYQNVREYSVSVLVYVNGFRKEAIKS